jgi:hypothetical protein
MWTEVLLTLSRCQRRVSEGVYTKVTDVPYPCSFRPGKFHYILISANTTSFPITFKSFFLTVQTFDALYSELLKEPQYKPPTNRGLHSLK